MSQNNKEHRIHNRENTQLEVSKSCVTKRESPPTLYWPDVIEIGHVVVPCSLVDGTNVVGEHTVSFFRA
jgi:hypothetical protein